MSDKTLICGGPRFGKTYTLVKDCLKNNGLFVTFSEHESRRYKENLEMKVSDEQKQIRDLTTALSHAYAALHRIQLPDYLIKNDVYHAYAELQTRMGWAKAAEKQLEEMTGMSWYEFERLGRI